MDLRILSLSEDNLARAARVLRAGGLIGLPTETVYGLACDAANGEAVARVYEAKGRPSFNPLIAHVSDLDMAQREGVFRREALALAETHWPGPLTLVVDVAPTGTVCDLARAGLDSIALRLPAHAIPINLIEAFGGPLVAPSANPSGKISPTKVEHVMEEMGDKLDLIFAGGTCAAGIESTIVDARGERPALLRPGSLDPAWIEEIWPGLIRPDLNPDAPQSPGQLLRHYAPRARLRLNAREAEPGEAMLGFGEMPATLNLSVRSNLEEAASNLFAMLRELDKTYDRIAVAPIPSEGIGEGINDRLTRAAK
ncbi:MAG: L-threonylcarbamoyladenylate synthase [Pseudomonadota bacterium]